MTKAPIILIFLLAVRFVTFGQRISESDSLKIMASIDTIFNVLKTADYATFERTSTKNIYCLPCFTSPNSKKPYMIGRKEFFKNHLSSIKQSDYFIRVPNSIDIIIEETLDDHFQRADVIVLFTIYKRNELAPGHEGGQFGLYLKKTKNAYKFSGLETIP